ncbi:DNA invertase Pin-like site-specific DNA recombinase [Arthrobacter globiformis]|nr:DNA invertase Pin-like site-specific DNA recombinase [Arthrobacter globiformis]
MHGRFIAGGAAFPQEPPCPGSPYLLPCGPGRGSPLQPPHLPMAAFPRGSSPRTGSKRTFWRPPRGPLRCRGVSGAHASRPQFEALDALIDGDTLVITTLDRLGRSTQNMLAFAEELRGRGAGLPVLNLGGGDVDTATPMGSMLFTIMAALAQMEHEIKRERVTDSISKRREAGRALGARPRRVTDRQIRSAVRLVQGGQPAAQVARDFGMSRATFHRRSRALKD